MKPCFARMKNFLTSFSHHVGSGGGGCVLASRSSRPWPGNFSLLSGISHKKKDGKGFSTFCCIGADTTRSQPQGGRRRDSGRQERQGRRRREGRACSYDSPAGQPYIKKGRPPYDGRPNVQRRRAYWPRSTSTGFSSRSSRNLSGRSFWSGTVMSPWTYSR